MLPLTLRRWLGFPDPPDDHAPVEPRGPLQPRPGGPPNAAWNAELAHAILADRDSDAPYARYAEWLAQNNDPRSVLIHAEDPAPLVASDPVHFLGPLAFEEGIEVVWKRGFWSAVAIDREWDAQAVPRLVRDALAHPSALVLDQLDVRADCIPDLADVLADSEVLPLRGLVADARGGMLGAWAAVWARVPRLARLTLVGDGVSLGDLDLPHLTHLEIVGQLTEDAQWSLARMSAPRLKVLRRPSGFLPEPAAMLAERFPSL
ncbi:MAG: hypothetical protein R3F61_35465 [Myxococcota bacterium]